jgi:beta-aspartyl-dipeptidase (metallo-type)
MLELLLDADVYAPQALGRRNLLIGGGKILWIGEDEPRMPDELDVAVRDLDGKRLIPGFIDGHAHITGGGGEAGYASRVPPLHLSRFTRSGVTSVVGLLGTDDCVRTTGQLVAQARALCDEGLSAWCWTGGYHVPLMTLTGSVRDDIVHVDRILGVGELAISDHRSSQPTLDELLRIASDAHVAGLMTGKAGVVHLHVGDGERGLQPVRDMLDRSEIPAPVFHPTHVNRRRALFEEALALAERGCTMDITSFPVAEDEDGWSAVAGLTRYLAAGMPPERVTVSSDGGGCLPVFDGEGRVVEMDVGRPASLIETLAGLVECGQPLERMLPPFTSNPARLLRLTRKGHLGVGADADIVVLDERGGAAEVMARGRWHVRGGRVVVRGTFE